MSEPTFDPRAIEKAEKELQFAANAIQAMRSKTTLPEFEHHWMSFLNAVNKSWVKLLKGTDKATRPAWLRNLVSAHKGDELLQYVRQARNSDEHTLDDSLSIQSGSISANFVNARAGHIKKLLISDGKILHYEGDPIQITRTPSRLRILDVVNRSERYPPPSTHLGERFESSSPFDVADAALKFFSEAIAVAKQKVFDSRPPSAARDSPENQARQMAGSSKYMGTESTNAPKK